MATAVDMAKASGIGTGMPRDDDREIDWVGYLFIAFFALPFLIFNIMPVFFGAYVAFTEMTNGSPSPSRTSFFTV
jgi:multiple sugar transport system permease protein